VAAPCASCPSWHTPTVTCQEVVAARPCSLSKHSWQRYSGSGRTEPRLLTSCGDDMHADTEALALCTCETLFERAILIVSLGLMLISIGVAESDLQ